MHISREGQTFFDYHYKWVPITRWLEHFRQARLTAIGKAVSRKVGRLVRSLDIWWLLEKPVRWKQKKAQRYNNTAQLCNTYTTCKVTQR